MFDFDGEVVKNAKAYSKAMKEVFAWIKHHNIEGEYFTFSKYNTFDRLVERLGKERIKKLEKLEKFQEFKKELVIDKL